ncbi:MAG: EpsG family protein [Bacteroidales bacterium]|jgi:hypothetical protein|nr:EpsG family protein [Bacteroidales bacterium]
MIIYIIIFLFSVISIYLSEITYNKYKIISFFFFAFAIIIPATFAGVRDISIGTDTKGYVWGYFIEAHYYKHLSEFLSATNSQIFYLIITWSVRQLTNNFGWLLFVNEAILLFFVYISAFRIKKLLGTKVWISVLIFFLLFYNMSFNLARQILAMAICLYSFTYLLEKKKRKSYIIALLALGFHPTVLFYFLIYPIYKISNSKYGQKHVSLIRLFIFLGASLIFILYDKIILTLISLDLLYSRYNTFISEGAFESDIPLSYLFLTLFLIAFILYIKLKVKMRNNYLDFFVLIFGTSFILCSVSFISVYASRIMYYFIFLSILILPYSLTFLKNKARIKLTYILIIFVLFYWYMAFIYSNTNQTYPYKFSPDIEHVFNEK